MCLPLSTLFFSIPCSSRGNGENNRFAPLPLGLAPPLENPRSAHKNIVKYRKFGQKLSGIVCPNKKTGRFSPCENRAVFIYAYFLYDTCTEKSDLQISIFRRKLWKPLSPLTLKVHDLHTGKSDSQLSIFRRKPLSPLTLYMLQVQYLF